MAPRASRRPREQRLQDYVLAFGLAGAALLISASLELVAPGIARFLVLLPAIVVAGVFCGTDAAAAAAGAALPALFFLEPELLAWPPLNPAQLEMILFFPACASVLWATHVSRRSARAAAAAEARLAEVFRQIPGAAAILEAPDGRLLRRSSQSDAVLGQAQRRMDDSGALAEYGGLHADGRRYAPDEYPIVRALKTGEIVVGEPLRYLRPDGRVADLEVYAGPVRGADNEIIASVGMAFDVSERAEGERRLRESEARHRALAERLRAAIDAGGLGTWELDLETRRIQIDAVFARMLGMPAEGREMAGAEMAPFIDPADLARAREVFSGAVAESGPYADELRMRTARGESRWMVSRGAVLAEAKKVVGVINDVSERRERENALRSALQARDVLMHEADHRIKNSLQLVVSLISLQLGRVRQSDAKTALRETIARVNAIANAHRALQNSADLRSLAIDGMLQDLCGDIAVLNPEIAIRCRTGTGLDLDTDRAIPLSLIASELLTNALRHAYPPGMPGEVDLTLGVVDDVLEMTVADRGRGQDGPLRSGLGATVMSSLARQIGATLVTASASGAGTSVSVALNLRRPEPSQR